MCWSVIEFVQRLNQKQIEHAFTQHVKWFKFRVEFVGMSVGGRWNVMRDSICKVAHVYCCVFSMSTVKYERIKFLVIALKNAVEVYAWAPKPYHKFMAFKVRYIVYSTPKLSLSFS